MLRPTRAKLAWVLYFAGAPSSAVPGTIPDDPWDSYLNGRAGVHVLRPFLHSGPLCLYPVQCLAGNSSVPMRIGTVRLGANSIWYLH